MPYLHGGAAVMLVCLALIIGWIVGFAHSSWLKEHAKPVSSYDPWWAVVFVLGSLAGVFVSAVALSGGFSLY